MSRPVDQLGRYRCGASPATSNTSNTRSHNGAAVATTTPNELPLAFSSGLNHSIAVAAPIANPATSPSNRMLA